MASPLANVIDRANEIGFFKFVLPFLLMFAIVYGLLEKLDILHSDRANAIVATVAGLFVSLFVYTQPAGLQLSTFLTQFFGAFAIVAVFLMAVVMGAGIGGFRDDEWAWDEGAKKLFFLLGALAVIAIFITWGGLAFIVGEGIPDVGFLSNQAMVILLVLVFAFLLIWWVTAEDEEEGGGGEE